VLSARLSNLIEACTVLHKPMDRRLLYRAKRSIVMWHEHTWGAWNSISEPDDPNVIAQWNYKKAFADSARWYVLELEHQAAVPPVATLYSRDTLPASAEPFKWKVVDGLDPSSARDQPFEVAWATEHRQEYLHLSYTIGVLAARDKRSYHLQLPFDIPNATVRIGIGDTCVTPESGRIPGSNNDFFCAQRWIDVSNDSLGVTIVCPQGAIWEVGDVVDERKVNPGRGTNAEKYKAWKTEAHSSSTLYLYALNNYWHTNFKADQEGPITFDLYLKMHGPFKLEEARRFGLEMTRPLITWWK
ncbi:MAG TPA: hypothetical protein PK760_03890, partial [Flavobacteriales bacterium]|nr:hypothetical protein [Flavobacteriales bacterium]